VVIGFASPLFNDYLSDKVYDVYWRQRTQSFSATQDPVLPFVGDSKVLMVNVVAVRDNEIPVFEGASLLSWKWRNLSHD